jgi:hypothetical protein
MSSYSTTIIGESKSRRMRWVEHVTRIPGVRYAYKVLTGRHDGKRSLGSPRSGWENIKMDLQEIVYERVE